MEVSQGAKGREPGPHLVCGSEAWGLCSKVELPDTGGIRLINYQKQPQVLCLCLCISFFVFNLILRSILWMFRFGTLSGSPVSGWESLGLSLPYSRPFPPQSHLGEENLACGVDTQVSASILELRGCITE